MDPAGRYGKTVLVTGSAGFIGSWIVEEFAARGWRVLALVHRKALVGYSGHLPSSVQVGDKLNLLNMGGVLGGELSDMWIEAEARRLGIGDRLSRLALEWLRQQGVHSVEIQVLRDNEASWKLYDRMGFKLESRVGRLLWDEYLDAPEE